MKTGWECPKCGRVYSPKVTECFECNKAPVASQPVYPYWWPSQPPITIRPFWETYLGQTWTDNTNVETVKDWPYQEGSTCIAGSLTAQPTSNKENK